MDPMTLGLVMGGSSLISGGLGLSAANKAEDQAKKATEYALWAEKYNRKKSKQILEPLTSAGTDALGQLQQGVDYADIVSGLENDPFYQFQLQQGLDAVQGSAAARGNLRSGATLKALTEYGQGMASQQAQQGYNRAMNRRNELMQLAGMGANALGSIAGRGSIAPQVAANTALQNADYTMQKANIMSGALGGALQGGMMAGAGIGLKDLLGIGGGGLPTGPGQYGTMGGYVPGVN